MNSYFAILASFALVVPVGMPDGPSDGHVVRGDEPVRAAPERERGRPGMQPADESLVSMLEAARRVPVQRQVRIEQRVILRFTAPSKRVRERMLDQMPLPTTDHVFEEGKARRCVRMNSIQGMQPSGENRLLLFMRNRKILSATLDRACSAEDFYSGFYVERSKDGRLCSQREVLQSRSGAHCEITRINHLTVQRD